MGGVQSQGFRVWGGLDSEATGGELEGELGRRQPKVLKSPFLPRERMEAMEKQIASLTGLVQSALLRGSEPETPR